MMKLFKVYLFARFENHTNIWANLAHTAIDKVWDSFSRTLIYIKYWPNSLDCTDLNQCGVRRDAELSLPSL